MEVGEDAEVLLAKYHTLGSTCGTAGVKQHQGIVAVIGRGILLHELKAFLGITAVQWQLCEAGLGNCKGRKHHLLVTGYRESHNVLTAADGI